MAGAGENTFVGYQAGLSNLTQSTNNAWYNIAVGIMSFYSNTTGYNNVANGAYSLYSNTTGHANTANGAFSLYGNTTGSHNTIYGDDSFGFNKTGSNNVAMGSNAGLGANNSSNISNSVLLGYEAGKALLTAGSNNILIGYKAGDALTTGAKNIVIGYDIDAKTVNATNTLNIGNLIYGTGLDGSGTTLSTGNIGIGTTTPNSLLNLYSVATTTFSVDSGATSKGSCLKLKDSDGSGYTYCIVNNGAMTCGTASCE